MSLDKLVDSSQLDSDLTSVANAIRAKSGGSGQLAFPASFVSAIQAIPSGGGGGDETWYDHHGILYKANMVIPSSIAPRYVREQYQYATHLVSFIQQYGTPSLDSDYGLFRNCTSLKTVWVARATFGTYCFNNCSALVDITLGRVGLAVTSVASGMLAGAEMQRIQSVTVYVNATDLSGVPSAVKDRIVPSRSPGAVITYKNYQTGETIATVTVE